MKEMFQQLSFQKKTLNTISQANDIIEDYQGQGYDLTVRQLYYQFVSKDLIPNSKASYDKLATTIGKSRLAGLTDRAAIKDRTRKLNTHYSCDSVGEALETAERIYAVDPWEDQDTYVEVWIEKDALLGVIEKMCRKYRVPFTSCRGFSSSSFMYESGKRMAAEFFDREKRVVVLHLGDHDPSGINMTEDIHRRLEMYSDGSDIQVNRVALNMDQVRLYNPPPNYAKETDSRFKDYLDRFGDKCWELDALEPSVINSLIEDNIVCHIDGDKWAAAKEEEAEGKAKIRGFIKQAEGDWDE